MNILKTIRYFSLLALIAGISSVAIVAAEPSFVVTLDAGHGGHDPGAIGSISREKNITLSLILNVGKRIETENPSVKVVYTRKTDRYLTLQERANVANNAHSDLFLSIHVNANNNHAAFGCETYTLGLSKSQSNLDVAMRENSVILLEDDYKVKYEGFNPKSDDSYIMFECIQDKFLDKSVSLASRIQENFANVGRKNRGVRQAGFWVLHKTAMPSVLVEVGYITNKDEETYLNSEEGQNAIATAIYDAFLAFKKEYELKSGTQNYVMDNAFAKKDNAETKEKSKSENQKKIEKERKDREKETLDSLKRIEELRKNEAKKETETKKKEGVIYRIQLFALSKRIASNSPSFKGLITDVYEENGLYKYTYGNTPNYDEIVRIKKRIATNFPNAIIIAFRNGEKISIREALEQK